MLSSSVLKSLKLSKSEFYKFVKANAITKSNKTQKTIQDYRTVVDRRLNNRDDDDDYEYGYGDDPGGGQANSCCGVYEVGGNLATADELKSEMLTGILNGYRCIVYYSINETITKAAEGWGFENCGTFRNHNSQNNIDVLILNLWED